MHDNHIQYIELYTKDLEQIKKFYSNTFAWTFTDYGDTYIAFEDSGVSGGFEKTEETKTGGALVILYHSNLEKIQEKVIANGGTIKKDIFSFPGGRRFHFLDPAGNELAIWSDNEKV